MIINKNKIFDRCRDMNYSIYDEAFIWEVVNVVCSEVEREIIGNVNDTIPKNKV